MEYEGLAAVIAEYINERKRQKREPIEKEIEKIARDAPNPTADSSRIGELNARLDALEETYVFHRWLTDAAYRARQISLATHAIKFTHADARGTSVLLIDADESESPYVSTTALRLPAVDAVGNAAALDVAKLLQLNCDGDSLAACLKRGDSRPLSVFSQSEEQLEEWIQGFKMALSDKALTTHTLAKQLYFPVGTENYHLVSPLYSSSLAQALYQRIIDSRFSDEAKNVRDRRKAGKYAAGIEIRYLNTAVQNFGGSKPQNISQLNSARGGMSYLLSCTPPSWRSEPKPPMTGKSIFSGEYNRRAWRQAKAFQQYLLGVRAKDSTLEIRTQVKAHMDTLIDTLFQYAAEVQGMTQHTGWSAQSKLKREQQLWLDPYRDDAQFQLDRASGDWQLRIADEFAYWLKRQLKHEQLVFGETEHLEWQRLFNRRLSLFNKALQEFESDLPEVTR